MREDFESFGRDRMGSVLHGISRLVISNVASRTVLLFQCSICLLHSALHVSVRVHPEGLSLIPHPSRSALYVTGDCFVIYLS